MVTKKLQKEIDFAFTNENNEDHEVLETNYRIQWEQGRPDFMGVHSFDNILNRLTQNVDENLNQGIHIIDYETNRNSVDGTNNLNELTKTHDFKQDTIYVDNLNERLKQANESLISAESTQDASQDIPLFEEPASESSGFIEPEIFKSNNPNSFDFVLERIRASIGEELKKDRLKVDKIQHDIEDIKSNTTDDTIEKKSPKKKSEIIRTRSRRVSRGRARKPNLIFTRQTSTQ